MSTRAAAIGVGTARPSYTYRHAHPAVAVDLVVFTVREQALHVLLVQRGVEPFKDRWALPGGFVRIDEDLPAAAERELREETGATGAYLEQVGAFGEPKRDPRERVISIAFAAIMASDHLELKAATDAVATRWWRCEDLPELAFDHQDILLAARRHIVGKLRTSPIVFQFLASEFTLTELQQVHEAILGNSVDKRNFRKWIATLDIVKPTGKFRRHGQHRPAELFRLRARGYRDGMHAIGRPSAPRKG